MLFSFFFFLASFNEPNTRRRWEFSITVLEKYGTWQFEKLETQKLRISEFLCLETRVFELWMFGTRVTLGFRNLQTRKVCQQSRNSSRPEVPESSSSAWKSQNSPVRKFQNFRNLQNPEAQKFQKSSECATMFLVLQNTEMHIRC